MAPRRGRTTPASKQHLHGSLGAVVIVLLIAACSPAKAPPNTSPPPAPDATDLTDCTPLYVVGDYESSTRPFELEAAELCRRFGVRPELRHPPYMWHDLSSFVAQLGDHVDLVILPPVKLDVYVGQGLLQPIDQWIDTSDPWYTDILPAYRNLYMRFGNHYYGFVYDGDSHLLFYRQDVFNSHGLKPPQTWAEHDEIARFLAQPGSPGQPPRYGTAMIGVIEKRYVWFAERYASYGGEYFDSEMHPLIDGPVGVRALKDWVSLQREVAPEATYDWADLNHAFLSGDLPMVIQWSDTARFSFDQTVWNSKVAGDVGWTLVPGEKSGAPRGGIWFGRIIGLAARSRLPELAAQVALYMTGPEVSGRMITRPDTVNDPYRFSHFAHPERQTLFPSPELARSFYETLQKALERPMADLTIPGGWEYTQALDQAVGKALRGELSPETALEEAAWTWEEITERYGREAQKAAYQDWRRRLMGGKEP